jgi:hypothetical protein
MKSKKVLWVALGSAAVLILWMAVTRSSGPSPSAARDHFSKDADSDTDWPNDASVSRRSDADDMADEDSPSASAAGKSWGHAQSQEVTDPQFGMTAYSVSVPEGWTFDGDIVRAQDCHGGAPSLEYSMESPDGQIVVRRLREMMWVWSSNLQAQRGMKCGSLDLTSAKDFLVNIIVPKLHESARVLEVLPPTEAAERAIEAQREHDQEKQSATAQVVGVPASRALVDGARVHIAYEENGQQFEEVLMAVVHCGEMLAPGSGAPINRTCQSGGGESVIRTAAGHLSGLMADPSFQRVAGDVRDNPAWQEQLASDQQAKFLRALQTMHANSQAIARAGDVSFRQRLQNSDTAFQAMMANSRASNANRAERFELSQVNVAAKEDAMHAGAQQTINFALDQQQYNDPYNGRIITASNQFNRVWAASDGSLAGTTGNADPNDYAAPGSPALTQAPTRY